MLKTKLAEAQKAYKKAKNENERVLIIDFKAKSIVLRNNIFKEENTGKRIFNPNSAFLMSDDDYLNYIELRQIERRKLGLVNVPTKYTADYLTADTLRRAEDSLLDLALILLPKTHEGINLKEGLEKAREHWQYRQEFINLTLKLSL